MSIHQYVSRPAKKTWYLHVLHEDITRIIFSDRFEITQSTQVATINVNANAVYLEIMDLSVYLLKGRKKATRFEPIKDVSVSDSTEENGICATILTQNNEYHIYSLANWPHSVELMKRLKLALTNDIQFDFGMPDESPLPPLFNIDLNSHILRLCESAFKERL